MFNNKLILLCVLFCLLFLRVVNGIVGGSPADMPPEDDPVVYTRFSGRAARVVGVHDAPHYVFRGIRYAEPPTGRDRFQRPRQYFLQGEINATRYPHPCVQPVVGGDGVVGDEDCLFLNIFTPTLPDGTEGLPVVIWIHGGGFRIGSASQYGVRHLVGKQLVIVTIQYRLGSLGFLSTGTTEMPGNVGIWDMALAVQFIRNYVGFFGGNPHRIVVMGHGTGASSALILSLSKIAKGLTSGVVAMSGTAVSHGAIDDKPTNTAHEIAEQNGCPTVNVLTMIRCLQNLPASSIIKVDSKLQQSRLHSRGFVSGLSGPLTPAPATEGDHDGRSLPGVIEQKPLDDMYYNKQLPKIPLLTGVTRDETRKAIEGNYKDEVINKLKSIPHFLDDVLVRNLQELTGLGNKKDGSKASSFWNHLDPLQFGNYLHVKRNDFAEGLRKISEATGDALFNLPAFLTAELWSKHGMPTFLYSFEHNGNARKGYEFLKGLPIVGNSTDGLQDAVSHGDDLAYLFDVRNLDGTPVDDEEAPMNEADAKVRDLYTQLISDFARFGHPNFENNKMPSFTTDKNDFIEISAKPKLSSNFRYCQMALWAGLAQRLHTASCKFLKVLDSQVKNVEHVLFDTAGNITQKHEERVSKIGKPLVALKPAHNEKGRMRLGDIIG